MSFRTPLAGRGFALDRRFRQNVKRDTSKIPYAVNRTSSGNLPVYVKVRGIDRTTVTYIESIYGDTDAFVSDLGMAVTGDAEITESGRVVQVRGRFAKPVKNWLQSLGF
jgi:large subunit ribosomal protein L49